MPEEQLWQAALGEIELSLSKANFTTWFKNTFICEKTGKRVTIGVPNGFTKAWLENKYHLVVVKALKNLTSHQLEEVAYKVATKPRERTTLENIQAIPRIDSVAGPVTMADENPKRDAVSGLNTKYNFDNFIVGKKNEFAHAAARAVSEKPGAVYNPLFIYGGVGLGKTHLLQAIGNSVLTSFPEKRVLYTTCEKFTNDFVQTIKSGKVGDFQKYYRSMDVLLIDDIHFIAGKEQTQEQFFHTFNELHQSNKQIIISSDRPPKAIPALEDRLQSRFGWGMTTDIGAPDLETRIAILQEKLSHKNFFIDGELINYIASNIQSNVRDLEGALNRIVAVHQLSNTAPTLDSIKNLLSTLSAKPQRGGITPRILIKAVSEFFELSVEEIVSTSRKKELVVPRQIAMYLLREEIKSSFPSIGQELGGRDHTTAMHAYTKITRVLEEDEKTRQDINLIRQRLYNS